jgi:hypothetical protein
LLGIGLIGLIGLSRVFRVLKVVRVIRDDSGTLLSPRTMRVDLRTKSFSETMGMLRV